jgi:hypothetical protein
MFISKSLCVLVAASFAFQSVAYSQPQVDESKLAALAEAHDAALSNQQAEAQAKLDKLRSDLKTAKGKPAQKLFKYLAWACGGVAAAGVVIVIASGREKLAEKFPKLLGADSDTRSYVQFGYGLTAAGAAICGVAAWAVFELIDGKADKIQNLIDVAEAELKQLKK